MTSLYSGKVIVLDKDEKLPQTDKNKAHFIFEYDETSHQLRIIKFVPDFISGPFFITPAKGQETTEKPDLWAD